MSYIGNTPSSVAFLTDQFSGTGSLTVFTMSVAPASTGSILVCITGVTQDPSTYSISGTTLTFSQAPPSGTGNISVRYLGIPASNIATTAYRTVTEFTATIAQTIFTVPSYTVGYINVYRNGVRLGVADYTATNGTTVVLTIGASTGDLVTTESFYVSSVLNAIPAVAGAVTSSYIVGGVSLTAPNISTIVNGAATLTLPTESGTIAIQTFAADLSWNSATDTYTRSTGLATTQTITNIHTKMKRCLLMDDGTVNYYLDGTNSALKASGGASVLTGVDGQVMVEIPKFYVSFTRVGTVNTWAISDIPLPDFVLHPAFIKDGIEVPYRYMGAYDACVNTTGTTYQSGLNWDVNVGANLSWNTATAKLSSVSGIYPAVGVTRNHCRLMAANRGIGWRQQDFFLTSAVQLLYLIEYGSFYSQSKIGAGNTAVAAGYLAPSGVQTDSPHSIAGKSNSVGNVTSAVASTVRDVAWMSYRGIENFFGNCWNFVDGININTHQAYITNQNQRSYYADDTTTNYTAYGAGLGTADGYVTNILPVGSAFLPTAVGGSSATHLTDYYWQAASGYQVAIFGGSADNGSNAGVFYWNLNNASANANRNIGTRQVVKCFCECWS
jgi:hypothetical protein